MMEWLGDLFHRWAAAFWFLSAGLFLPAWYLALRAKHRPGIQDAAVEVHRRRYLQGEISKEEFDRLRRSLSGK